MKGDNMKFHFLALLVIFSIVGLSGCSKEPPKCSDPKTILLLRQIIVENLGSNFPAASLNAKDLEDKLLIQNPRASSYDEKVHKFSCEGTLIVPYKDSNTEYRVNIEYASQLDDNKKHLVILKNMHEGDLRQISFALRQYRQMAAEGSAAERKAAEIKAALAAVKAEELNPSFSRKVWGSNGLNFKEPFEQKFRTLLSTNYDKFHNNLSVFNDKEEGNYYFGSGCAPHVCSIEEAAFAIDKSTGEVSAAILTEGKEGKQIKIFGVNTAKELPPPLYNWYKERSKSN